MMSLPEDISERFEGDEVWEIEDLVPYALNDRIKAEECTLHDWMRGITDNDGVWLKNFGPNIFGPKLWIDTMTVS